MNMNNPELRRYLWRNFSSLHLALPPLLVGIFLLLVSPGSASLLEVANGALWVVGALLVIQRAAMPLAEEYAERTWDFQCMSSRGAFSILIGKWLGATAYGWYVILCVLAGLWVLGAGAANPAAYLTNVLFGLFSLFCGSLAAFTFGVFTARPGPASRLGSFLPVMLGLGYAVATYAILRASLHAYLALGVVNPFLSSLGAGGVSVSSIIWYGLAMPLSFILPVTLLIYTLWVLAAGWHALRGHLRYRQDNYPVLLFLAFHTLYVLGFAGSSPALLAALLSLSITGLLLAALTLVMEPLTDTGYRRLALSLGQRQLKAALHQLPKWLIFVIFGLVLLALGALLADSLAPAMRASEAHLPSLLAAVFFFFLRDAVLYHIFVVGRADHRAGIVFFICLAMYYLLLLPQLPAYLNPFQLEGTGAAWFTALLQLGAVIVLATLWWRKGRKSLPVSPR